MDKSHKTTLYNNHVALELKHVVCEINIVLLSSWLGTMYIKLPN